MLESLISDSFRSGGLAESDAGGHVAAYESGTLAGHSRRLHLHNLLKVPKWICY